MMAGGSGADNRCVIGGLLIRAPLRFSRGLKSWIWFFAGYTQTERSPADEQLTSAPVDSHSSLASICAATLLRAEQDRTSRWYRDVLERHVMNDGALARLSAEYAKLGPKMNE